MTGRVFVAWAVLLSGGGVAHGQRQYELVLEDTGLVSQAERTPQRLMIIDSAGNPTEYTRDRRFDSQDRGFIAYSSAAARQVLRWPADDRGRMQIAELVGDRPTAFRPSRMTIRALQPAGGGGGIGGAGAANIEFRDPVRLVSAARVERHLGALGDGRLTLGLAADDDAQAWLLTPLDNGYYRIHNGLRGRRWSLSGRPGGRPRLERTARDVNQLWQVLPIHDRPGWQAFACAGGGPARHVLTVDGAGVLALQPFVYATSQMWLLRPWGVALPPVFAEYRFVTRELRPNPPLEPASVEFVNDHSRELWVLVADRLDPAQPLRLRIPAGKSQAVSLVRDAGGTLVEVYEYGSPGLAQRDEFATPLPPSVRYDVSVYEVIVQSIAIDRTVPGGKLEDVNYAPKSVGWFALAPGPELESGPLDVYATAVRQKNAGAVRRIDPSEWQPQAKGADPVESLLDEFKKNGE